MAAGVDHAHIDICTDHDKRSLQNDPDDIPWPLKKIHIAYRIVAGWRYLGQDKLVSRKIPTRIAYG